MRSRSEKLLSQSEMLLRQSRSRSSLDLQEQGTEVDEGADGEMAVDLVCAVLRIQ